METTLLEYTATALVEEYLLPPAKQQKRRTRVFLALFIFIIFAFWYLLRKLCRGWGRRIPARVLSHWEHFTVHHSRAAFSYGRGATSRSGSPHGLVLVGHPPESHRTKRGCHNLE